MTTANNNETDPRYAGVAALLLGAWVFISAALWTTFAMTPTGVTAVGDAGVVISVAPASITTTKGVFSVAAKSVSLRPGDAMQIERINNAYASSYLRLCTVPQKVRGTGRRCTDLTGGYLGPMTQTPLARRAWSGDALTWLWTLAVMVTGLGWVPGAFLSLAGDSDEGAASGEGEGGD